MSTRWKPSGPVSRFVNELEETAIALILGFMVIFTFANVVLRKLGGWDAWREFEVAMGFDWPGSILWSLEVVTILFAWLVIFGVCYGFKITSHLGVDAITNLMPSRGKRVCAMVAGAVCVAYALLMLKGGWDFWAPYAALERTSGRWFPTGFEQTRDQAWFVTDQVPPMRWLFGWLEGAINQGEEYEQLPRVIPYVIMPLGAALMLLRVTQAVLRVWQGRQASLIVSHEAEEAVEDVAATRRMPAGAKEA